MSGSTIDDLCKEYQDNTNFRDYVDRFGSKEMSTMSKLRNAIVKEYYKELKYGVNKDSHIKQTAEKQTEEYEYPEDKCC